MPITVFYRNIRSAWIFAGSPWEGEAKRHERAREGFQKVSILFAMDRTGHTVKVKELLQQFNFNPVSHKCGPYFAAF